MIPRLFQRMLSMMSVLVLVVGLLSFAYAAIEYARLQPQPINDISIDIPGVSVVAVGDDETHVVMMAYIRKVLVIGSALSVSGIIGWWFARRWRKRLGRS